MFSASPKRRRRSTWEEDMRVRSESMISQCLDATQSSSTNLTVCTSKITNQSLAHSYCSRISSLLNLTTQVPCRLEEQLSHLLLETPMLIKLLSLKTKSNRTCSQASRISSYLKRVEAAKMSSEFQASSFPLQLETHHNSIQQQQAFSRTSPTLPAKCTNLTRCS